MDIPEGDIRTPHSLQAPISIMSGSAFIHSDGYCTSQSIALPRQTLTSLGQGAILVQNSSRGSHDLLPPSRTGNTAWTPNTTGPARLRYRQHEELSLEKDLLLTSLNERSEPFIVRILLGLSDVLLDQGRYRYAEIRIREAVSACSKQGGNENEDMLDALGYLGRVFYLQGAFLDAVKI